MLKSCEVRWSRERCSRHLLSRYCREIVNFQPCLFLLQEYKLWQTTSSVLIWAVQILDRGTINTLLDESYTFFSNFTLLVFPSFTHAIHSEYFFLKVKKCNDKPLLLCYAMFPYLYWVKSNVYAHKLLVKFLLNHLCAVKWIKTDE